MGVGGGSDADGGNFFVFQNLLIILGGLNVGKQGADGIQTLVAEIRAHENAGLRQMRKNPYVIRPPMSAADDSDRNQIKSPREIAYMPKYSN